MHDDVQSWLAARGVEPSGAVETIHDRPWSTVLRVPTHDGDLYLKQEQPLQAYEVALTAALASRWPDRVPEVVAADINGAEKSMNAFETLTLAPIDRRLIDAAMLNRDELAWLDAYHTRVRAEVGPALDEATKAWLDQATAGLT